MSTERSALRPVLETITQRRDFLAAARARKYAAKGFVLQRRVRDDDGAVRVGYTASKKVGNAVIRNRAKRRMRALAREIIAQHGVPGSDYVLIARAEHTVARDFAELRSDLLHALAQVHRERAAKCLT